MSENINQKTQNSSDFGQDVTISEITAENTAVNIICRVISINSKEYEKNGRTGMRYFGLIEDNGGAIPFSAWRNPGIARNDVIQISNAKVKQWQDVLSINIGAKTVIKRITDEKIINKFRKGPVSLPARKLQLGQFQPGLSNISVICRIISIEPIDVKIKGEPTTVFKGIVADKTGSLRFTAWKDFGLLPESVIEINGASAKVWNGFLELNINKNSKIDTRSDELLSPSSELSTEKKISISKLFDEDYLTTPEFILQGNVIEFKNGSGVITRCSQCLRAVADSKCQIHGKTNLKQELRLKAILDDGTGAVTVFFGNELSEKFLVNAIGESTKSTLKISDLKMSNDTLLSGLILKEIRVKGNVFRDDFGISIIATSVEPVEITENELRTEAKEILNELG
jgi:replication factor A1